MAFVCAVLVWACTLVLSPRPAWAQQPCTPPAQSLVNWYRGQGDGADARGTRDATLTGGVAFTSGRVGQAFSFDGVDDFVTSAPTQVLNSPGPITIEAWVRPALRSDGTDFPANVVANRSGSGTGPSGRGFGLNVFTGGSQLKVLSGNLLRTVPGVSFTADTWYHVAVVYTDYDFKVYVNGQLVDQVDLFNSISKPAIFPGDDVIRIGWNVNNSIPPDPGNRFKGLIDEVSIYNGALSATEISAIVNAVPLGKCSTQSCVVQLDSLFDWYQAEGNANDTRGGRGGTLVNGATFTTGKVGQAFNFDGVNDYVQLPDNLFPYQPSVSGKAQFSFEAWFRTTSGGVILGQQNTAALTTTPTGWIPAIYVGTDGLLYAQPFYFQPQPPLKSTVAVNDGIFHHIALTFDDVSDDLNLYLDGVLIATKSAPQQDYAASYKYQLGTGYTASWPAGNGGWYSFTGQIDEASIYGRALTPIEVQAQFTAGGQGKCVQTCTTPLPPAGLVAWYPGDGYGGDVRGGNDAFPTRGAGFAPGRIGQAFSFDGVNGNAQVDDAVAHKPSALTLTGWVRFNSLDSLDANNVLVPNGPQYIIFKKNSRTTGNLEGYALYKSNGTNRLVFQITSAAGVTTSTISTTTVATGQFYHVAAAYDGTTMRLYVNGVQEAAQSPAIALNYGTERLYFGASGQASLPGLLNGLLDEVQIYNRALTQTEVQALSNAGKTGNCQSNIIAFNDNFINAQPLIGTNGRVADNNLTATKEAGEPNHAGNTGGASRWYVWQAPASGNYLLTTYGSDFDTLVGVYTGSAVNALTTIAGNDDNGYADNLAGHTLTSSLTFSAAAGTTYYIAVDGAGGRRGNYTLAWGLDVSVSGYLICSLPGRPNTCGTVPVLLLGDDGRQLMITTQLQGSNTFSFAHLRVGGNYQVRLGFDGRNSTPAYLPFAYYLSTLTGPTNGLIFANPQGSSIQPTVTAAGRVTGADGGPLGGVTVSVTGTASRSVLTDQNGYYTLTSLPNNGNYTVTPALPNYNFTPANRVLTNLSSDIAGANFAAQDTYTISGQVRDSANAALAGATVSLSGTQTASVQSDAGGFYTFPVQTGGSYTVTVAKLSYVFAQSSQSFPNVSANQKNADFTGTFTTYTISGRATEGANGLGGVAMTLSGTQTANTSTNANGDYSFTGLSAGGSFTVTPTKAFYTFSPASTQFNNLAANQTANFAGTRLNFTISGRIADVNNAPLASVSLGLTGTQTGTTSTNAQGNYSFTVGGGGDYTVTPTLANYTFTPGNRSFSGLSTNQTSADFTATASAALRIDTVSPRAGRAAGGQQITLTGAFTNLSSVMIGGISATINSNSGSQVVVTTPAHAIGAVQIDLIPTSGTSYTKQNAFAYLPTVFTDNTLTVGVTTAKAQHVLELRQAVDALRAVAGLVSATWTDPTLTPNATRIKAAHIMELRARLEEAAVALGYTQMAYTDPNLNTGSTIKRIHIEELRQRIRNIAG